MLSATIGWIDFSPSHRDRVGAVLDLLRPEGMVDELGMGTVRDALANQIFPGISTIQTRARYFFLVPYILYEYVKLSPAKRGKKRPSEYLEQREYELMWDLSDHYRERARSAGRRDGFGVIGFTKPRGKKVVRRPSAIYWNGMNTFGFLDSQGFGVNAFVDRGHNKQLADLLLQEPSADDELKEDTGMLFENTFRLRVQPPDPGWEARVELTETEAAFFKDRVITVAGTRLLGYLLKDDKLWREFLPAESFTNFAKVAVGGELPGDIRNMIILAHDFSELMFGAHIFYNHLLQQKAHSSDHFVQDWTSWKTNFRNDMIQSSTFDPEVLFHYAVTTTSATRSFVREWWAEAKAGFPNSSKLAEMITQQEARAKGRKARLAYSKFDDVRQESWIGLRRFEYRFNQARTILSDIKQLPY